MTEENAHVAPTGASTPGTSFTQPVAATYAPVQGEGLNVAQGFLWAFAIVSLVVGLFIHGQANASYDEPTLFGELVAAGLVVGGVLLMGIAFAVAAIRYRR